MLIAYDAAGQVIATLDAVVVRDEEDRPYLVDIAAHEAAGGEMTDVWRTDGVGSKVWPEHLGAAALAFRVELDGPPGRKQITALVHRDSGHRRERADISYVGTPGRPITLDAEGRNAPRVPHKRPSLPLVKKR